MNRLSRIVAVGIAIVAIPSFASAQTWAQWTAFNPGVVTGTLLGSPVSYTGNYAGGQTSSGGGTDYFSPNSAYTQSWGCGSYTTSGNSLTGYEFSGTIQFAGSLSQLSIVTDPGENWHGITVGADAVTATPEPASLALVGTELFGLAAVSRRCRKNVA